MSRTRFTRRRLVAVGIGTLAVLLSASPASALTVGDGNCNGTDFCVYQNASYGGSVADFSNGTTEYDYGTRQYYNTSTSINDRTSSTNNNSSYAVHLYDGTNGNGNQHKCYDPGEATASYGDFDNSASSHIAGVTGCGSIGT